MELFTNLRTHPAKGFNTRRTRQTLTLTRQNPYPSLRVRVLWVRVRVVENLSRFDEHEGFVFIKLSRVLDTGLDLWQSRGSEVYWIKPMRYPASPGYLYTYICTMATIYQYITIKSVFLLLNREQ